LSGRQDRDQAQRDGLIEVQCPRGLFEDLRRVLEVGVDVVGESLGPAGQQRTRVRENDGVVVDVDDPRVRGDALGDLVDVLRGGQPGADVEELPDAVPPGQLRDGPAKDVPDVPSR